MLNKKTNEYKGSFYHSKNRDDDAVNDIDITFEGIDAMLIYSLTPGSTSQFKQIKVCKEFCEGAEQYYLLNWAISSRVNYLMIILATSIISYQI